MIGRWRVIKQLGKGHFAKVYKVEHVESGSVAALKRLDTSCFESPQEHKNLDAEAAVLAKISPYAHPCVVNMLEPPIRIKAKMYFVLELADGGELEAALGDTESNSFPLSRVLWYSQMLVDGLRFLHSVGIIHRDLKPENIMLTSAQPPSRGGSCPWPGIKIADFGFSRSLRESDLAGSFLGTPLYQAPEVFKYEPYGHKADLWSLGAIIFRMATGRNLISVKTKAALRRLHSAENIDVAGLLLPPPPDHAQACGAQGQAYYPDPLLSLLGDVLLVYDPLARGSMADVVASPWLAMEEYDAGSKVTPPSPLDDQTQIQTQIQTQKPLLVEPRDTLDMLEQNMRQETSAAATLAGSDINLDFVVPSHSTPRNIRVGSQDIASALKRSTPSIDPFRTVPTLRGDVGKVVEDVSVGAGASAGASVGAGVSVGAGAGEDASGDVDASWDSDDWEFIISDTGPEGSVIHHAIAQPAATHTLVSPIPRDNNSNDSNGVGTAPPPDSLKRELDHVYSRLPLEEFQSVEETQSRATMSNVAWMIHNMVLVGSGEWAPPWARSPEELMRVPREARMILDVEGARLDLMARSGMVALQLALGFRLRSVHRPALAMYLLALSRFKSILDDPEGDRSETTRWVVEAVKEAYSNTLADTKAIASRLGVLVPDNPIPHLVADARSAGHRGAGEEAHGYPSCKVAYARMALALDLILVCRDSAKLDPLDITRIHVLRRGCFARLLAPSFDSTYSLFGSLPTQPPFASHPSDPPHPSAPHPSAPHPSVHAETNAHTEPPLLPPFGMENYDDDDSDDGFDASLIMR